MTQLPCEKPTLFKGRHFNHLLIIQAVRWYVTYKLSYRDVCDKKGQFDTSEITGPGAMILQVWEAALAA